MAVPLPLALAAAFPALSPADAAGAAGLALFAVGLAVAGAAPRLLVRRPGLTPLLAAGAVLWGAALFAAWYAWSAPARQGAGGGEPLTLALTEPAAEAALPLDDPFASLPPAQP